MRPSDCGNFRYAKELPMRRRLVFIEGIDGAGKTSLYYNVMHLSGHDVLFYPRGPMGRLAYSRHDGSLKRGYPAQQIRELELKLLSTDAYAIVWLDPPVEICFDRSNGEVSLEELRTAQACLLREFDLRTRPPYNMNESLLIRLDNSDITPEQTAAVVLAWAGSKTRVKEKQRGST